jgi:hypothetical protein
MLQSPRRRSNGALSQLQVDDSCRMGLKAEELL